MIILKMKENSILNAEILYPDMPLATFTDELTKRARKDLITNHNYGGQMLEVYQYHRGNMTLENVMRMLEKMEALYREANNEFYANRLGGSEK